MPESNKEHWEHIFSTKAEQDVGWFQPYPKTSAAFLDLFNLPPRANIIDVGAGDSHFVDILLERGYENIWILDISATAIERMQKRLGDKAKNIHWVVSDVVDFQPEVGFDFWHDRAAFHFLTTEDKISRYVDRVENAVRENGYLILGTFSEQGPKTCSGLVIQQYSETSLSSRFTRGFRRIKCFQEDHMTPFQTVQNYLFCSFQKRG